MIDFIKDSAEAWLGRVKSPIIGSIALIFFVCNWKPLWYLVFAEVPVSVKFRFFDLNTSIYSLYFWPVVVGLIYAIGSPWLKLAGSLLASTPMRKDRRFQASEASSHRLARLEDLIAEEAKKKELEAARAETETERDNRAIDAAKRLDDAKEIGGGEAVQEVLANRERFNKEDEIQSIDYHAQLNQRDLIVLEVLAHAGERIKIYGIPPDVVDNLSERFQVIFPNLNQVRVRAELEGALQKFSKLGLADFDSNGSWMLTSAGFSIVDEIKN